MNTKPFAIIAFILSGAILTSCSSSFNIAKRQYNQGYYLSFELGNKKINIPEFNSADIKSSGINKSHERIIYQNNIVKDDKCVDSYEELPLTATNNTKISSAIIYKKQQAKKEFKSLDQVTNQDNIVKENTCVSAREIPLMAANNTKLPTEIHYKKQQVKRVFNLGVFIKTKSSSVSTSLKSYINKPEITIGKILLYILCIIPPLAVLICENGLSDSSTIGFRTLGRILIALLLTFLFYVPGVIYAIYRVSKSDNPTISFRLNFNPPNISY